MTLLSTTYMMEDISKDFLCDPSPIIVQNPVASLAVLQHDNQLHHEELLCPNDNSFQCCRLPLLLLPGRLALSQLPIVADPCTWNFLAPLACLLGPCTCLSSSKSYLEPLLSWS